MLFNSFHFIFLFLPITFAVWQFIKLKINIRVALVWLSCASLFFYAIWNVNYLILLLTSICANFFFGGRILSANRDLKIKTAQIWMVVGVCLNLCVLGAFKYSYFIISNAFYVFNLPSPIDPIVLPLAISFVTFQKIAYLVDCKRGVVLDHNPLDYIFFVSFFPQLIAGPIVHHKPLISQTKKEQTTQINNKTALVAGVSFFCIGLFKKVIFADSFAHYATPVFDNAQHNIPTLESSWQAMLAYTLQLYFDFSGYSDMAIGLALLFGFKLPINFLSPYKATSIIDFWHRWHITLSTFLRDYLYIPLGGNRNGKLNHLKNLWITMLLAGLWHGAGWTFILWGVFHGTLLIFNQVLRNVCLSTPTLRLFNHQVFTPFKIFITFFLIAFGWVLFRSADISTAFHMYSGLFNFTNTPHFSLPNWHSQGEFIESFLSTSTKMAWIWILIGLCSVMALPSSSQLLKYDPDPQNCYELKPRLIHGILIGIGFWFVLKWMAVRPATEFLYFNF